MIGGDPCTRTVRLPGFGRLCINGGAGGLPLLGVSRSAGLCTMAGPQLHASSVWLGTGRWR